MTYFEDSEARWDALVSDYKEACGQPEGSRNFMPGLWQKIDQKRSRAASFERAARSLFAAAVGLTLVLGAFLFLPNYQPSAFMTGSYVEEIASANTVGSGTFFEPVRLEYSATEPRR